MSIQLFFLDGLIRFTMKRRFKRNPDVMELRDIMQDMGKRRPAPLPAHIKRDARSLGGVAAERLRTDNADMSRAILYIHGGGFVGGEPASHRALTWRLADKTATPVYSVDYRLAPEFPFPAGLDDCVTAYRGLLDSGIAASSIVIGGDSAGGNLTLATALKLKMLGLPQPAGLVCLSPATSIGTHLPSHSSNGRSDAMFVPAMFDTLTKAYCPGRDPSDPLISPLRGDVRGLPPTLIQCSGAEMLRDDGVQMAAKMREAGVDVTIEVWPGVFHVWQLMADVLPEGRRAVEVIAAFIRKRLVVGA